MSEIRTTFLGWTIGEIKAAAPSELRTRLQQLEAARIAMQHEKEFIKNVLKKNAEGPSSDIFDRSGWYGDSRDSTFYPGLTIEGIVGEKHHNGYSPVNCPKAPTPFQLLWLEPWAIRSAKTGDHVLLEYRKTGPGIWGWVVTEIKNP